MRILHLADVHLDRPFVRGDRREGDRDRARVRETFRRCIGEAAERGADAVTIGGDLWEDEHVSADTRRFVAGELGRLDCPVLIVNGNHDPFRPGGHYERTQWPENVTLFREARLVEARLDDEVSVWGASWTHEEPTSELLEERVTPEDGRTHLLLLHGTATPFAELADDPGHCPFAPEQVPRAGFELCLAGHIHRASHADGVVYPGSPEPLGWGEIGRHCAALVDIDSEGCRVELIDTNTHAYEELEVDCEKCEHSAECEERLGEALGGLDGENRHLRVILKGEIARDCRLDPKQLAAPHQARFAELQLADRTHPAYDLDALAAQPDATGHFVGALRERIDAEEDPAERRVLELALSSGLRALDGREDIVRVD